ncbi:toxin co-regulated pilus biosynthesis Q family protein [Pseudomonas syringae]|uniref:toxin co-regulated pilus biosynthesis Q family protein n=1 Tax=Pseudomonas syringae TaxID=317 RepID=UPI00245BBFF1|nr:toxin co-regulated pilus biosynthesis Q family protein [Pseudomonas syringae]MDH4602345.1 toxin co-regulated pilus biosynthesis Q family protein [Pseudomonas syringae pv. papulans]
MKYSFIALALAAATLSPTAFGGFSIQDTQILGSEDAAMGKYQPYEAPANGSFRSADGSPQSNQERYKDAELMVDLAYTAVSQRGNGPAPVYDGFGDDLPFTSAMTMILPQGWRFYRDKDLDPKAVPAKVSYPGGRPWPEVMKQIGDRYALHFHLDWYDRTVMMTKGRLGAGMQTAHVKVINEPTVAPINAVVASAAPTSAVATGVAPSKSFTKSAATPVAVVTGSVSKTLAPAVSVPKVATPSNFAVAVPIKPSVPAVPAPPPIPSWEVTPKDRTMREALKKWASTAGWTFQPEHWAVPVDIPLTAGASFRGDFKTAVRQLISSTELSETPLQPCFYSNRVVRVVPINEMCDRMSAR